MPAIHRHTPLRTRFLPRGTERNARHGAAARFQLAGGARTDRIPIREHHAPGASITTAVGESVDVLIILYTDLEISALLEVFTGDSVSGTLRARKRGMRTATISPSIKPKIRASTRMMRSRPATLQIFPSMTIWRKKVALYRNRMHPKTNRIAAPFIPVIKQLGE